MKSVKNENYKFKLMLLSLLVLTILIMGGTFFTKVYLTKNIINEAEKKIGDESINVLVVGLDIGDPEQKNNENIKRTDTILMVKLNPKDKKAVIVSIPRDILVVAGGRNQKINNLMMLEGEEGLKRQVEAMLYQKIDYIMKVNYEGFRMLMDDIGGVDIDIDNDMKYDDITQDLHIDLKKGKNVHLNGEQCEQYFRWRKNNDGSGLSDGDIGRINNQHKFIEAVVKKVKSPRILLSLPSILEDLPKAIETDMDVKEIMGYALSIMDVKSGIKMVTLKGDPIYISKISYLKYNEDRNKDIIDMLREVSGGDDNRNIDRQGIKIKVLNGTNRNGLAATVAGRLSHDGYKDVGVGNAAHKYEKSYLMIKNDNIKEILSNDTGIESVKEVSSNELGEYDAFIVLGNDYTN